MTVVNIKNLFCKTQIKPNQIDGAIMTLGPLLSVILLAVLNMKDYTQALLSHGDSRWHTPLASWNMPSIIVILIVGSLSYIVMRKFQLQISPLLLVMCISCMIISCILYAVWIIQLSVHIFDIAFFPGDVFYLCIFPLNFIICCISITKKVIREYTLLDNEKVYSNLVLNKCNMLLRDSKNWPLLAIILMIPILAIILLILMLFGQQPSAVIKAFTETSDWLLSQKVSPPPIETDAHYLCTVSLRGHRRLVRPIRYGVRNKKRIIVNRQLCVANAFEQIIQERAPKTHCVIRNVYDKYGYPLSKHIINPISADIVYILMKPLEWFFVIIIYFLDKHPEDRIAIQYLPLYVKNQY